MNGLGQKPAAAVVAVVFVAAGTTLAGAFEIQPADATWLRRGVVQEPLAATRQAKAGCFRLFGHVRCQQRPLRPIRR